MHLRLRASRGGGLAVNPFDRVMEESRIAEKDSMIKESVNDLVRRCIACCGREDDIGWLRIGAISY